MNGDAIKIFELAMQFAIFPAVALLWRINNEIHSLRLIIVQDQLKASEQFVKKSELRQLVFGVNHETQG